MIYERVGCGDHLLTHFQCDLCHFHNMQVSNPETQHPDDDMLMMTREGPLYRA